MSELDVALKNCPAVNVAMRGGGDARLIIIDRDDRNGGKLELEKLSKKLGSLPKTVKYKSQSGGYNSIYSYPADLPESATFAKMLCKGVDLLAGGRSAIMPGSRGVKGQYRWAKGCRGHDAYGPTGRILSRAWGGTPKRRKAIKVQG